MQILDKFQQCLNHRWSGIVALALGALFVILILLKLFSGLVFTFSSDDTQPHQPILNQTQDIETVNLGTLNIFGVYQPTTIDPNALPKATINLQLNGVFLAVPEKFSQAVLSEPGGQQTVYYEGDTLPGDAKLYRILVDSVIIQYNGELQRLLLPVANLQLGKQPTSLDLPKNSVR